VEHYFEDDELVERPTVFERNNNIRRFSFETPFTKTGKSHGSLVEQLKRKTILTSTKSKTILKNQVDLKLNTNMSTSQILSHQFSVIFFL
jgi:hypothetical protein